MPCFCPGCVTVALLRARRSVLLAIFGPFASMLGSVGQALAALRACLDCYGSTTCLHRGDLYVVHAFSELQRNADFVVSENIGPYHTSLPPGLPCSNRDGRYYLADDDKAFLVRAMPESSKVAIVATLDIIPNKVGRVTWLTTAIVVEPLSTPICDFKYLA
ncbi:hypothetical protein GQ42DRAFT_165417 [Ramicandelaber brevisporus]|nr:hypothetical protein GQ42DRAFT_165417 [Ramicandelaber brevisporus]